MWSLELSLGKWPQARRDRGRFPLSSQSRAPILLNNRARLRYCTMYLRSVFTILLDTCYCKKIAFVGAILPYTLWLLKIDIYLEPTWKFMEQIRIHLYRLQACGGTN